MLQTGGFGTKPDEPTNDSEEEAYQSCTIFVEDRRFDSPSFERFYQGFETINLLLGNSKLLW